MYCVDYIPVIKENYDMWERLNAPYFVPAKKIQIDKIIIDKKFVPNPLCLQTVQTICEYFNEWNWYPIIIDENNYLRDGQHRIAFAKSIGLRYIDAILQDQNILQSVEGNKCKEKKQSSRFKL